MTNFKRGYLEEYQKKKTQREILVLHKTKGKGVRLWLLDKY